MRLRRYSDRALADLERLSEFLAQDDPAAASATGSIIIGGLRILDAHPLIGRSVGDGLRELAISRGRSGYVALYEYRPAEDLLIIRAIRHQRETGFED